MDRVLSISTSTSTPPAWKTYNPFCLLVQTKHEGNYVPSTTIIVYVNVKLFDTAFWRLMHSYTLHNTKYGVSCYDNSTHGYLSPCNINQLRVFNNADRCWWRKLLRISPPLVVDDYDATGRCSTGSQSTLDSTIANPVNVTTRTHVI